MPLLNERLEKIREAPHVPEAVSCPSEAQKASFVKRSEKKKKHRSLSGGPLYFKVTNRIDEHQHLSNNNE